MTSDPHDRGRTNGAPDFSGGICMARTTLASAHRGRSSRRCGGCSSRVRHGNRPGSAWRQFRTARRLLRRRELQRRQAAPLGQGARRPPRSNGKDKGQLQGGAPSAGGRRSTTSVTPSTTRNFVLRGLGDNVEVWVAEDIAFPAGDCRNTVGGGEGIVVTDAAGRELHRRVRREHLPERSRRPSRCRRTATAASHR